MKRLSVRINRQPRAYPIFMGNLEKEFVPAFNKLKSGQRVLIVTSDGVHRAGHSGRLLNRLVKGGYRPKLFRIPNGEKSKSLATTQKLYAAALNSGMDRRSSVIALGGGVVTDLTGFFAATYMRGIPFVSVPTTLLGMVDAAIGGKTGVDLPQGKNLVGCFWQPSLVWIDPRVLSTLPRTEWITGFAEIIKYGVIRDRRFFMRLQRGVRQRPDVRKWREQDIEDAIFTCAKIKAQLVSKDERETPLGGGREILNFGHTVGHALEAATGYHALTHGEAISVGMAAAGLISRHLKQWSDDAQLQLLSLLQTVGLPIHVPARVKVDWPEFWRAIRRDKKVIDGKLRFVLPKSIGRVEVRSGISLSVVESSMRLLGMN